jgi:hypothetical protein
LIPSGEEDTSQELIPLANAYRSRSFEDDESIVYLIRYVDAERSGERSAIDAMAINKKSYQI